MKAHPITTNLDFARASLHEPDLVHAGQVHFEFYLRLMGAYKWALGVSSCFAVLAVIGYATQIRILYQPFVDGPGTHLFSALTALLVLYAFVRWVPLVAMKRDVKFALVAATLLSSYSMYCALQPQGPLTFMEEANTALQGALHFDALIQKGWNTSVTLIFVSASQLLRQRHATFGLLLSSFSPFFPLSALVGHILSLDVVHGAMSLPTIAILLPLAFANILSFIHAREVRVLVSNTALGKLGRFQLASAAFVPLALWAIFAIGGSAVLLPASTTHFVISMIWFVALTVVYSARAHEFTERKRRENERHLSRASITDVLTGASNRFGASLAISRGGYGAQSGVILVDLDHFKGINDQYGHDVGDRVLVAATAMMRTGLREADVLARWGGEEFLIVLPSSGKEIALVVAERLRAKLRGLSIEDTSLPQITASFGVSKVEPGEISIEAAVKRADDALYQAKDTGRDRVLTNFVRPPRDLLT
ncbi:MAG: diguanylate cyclase [Maritimibacter sp.]